MRIFNRKALEKRRKDLRNNLTPTEVILWNYLKHSKFAGRKFRRQTSIKNFIVDFYCPEEKLVIELGGEVHFNEEKTMEYDKERTKFLESIGLKVIRFENNEVLFNINEVLISISKNFKTKI